MRPSTLADAVESIQAGSPRDVVLAEFVDAFDLAKTDQDRYASIEREPKLTGDVRLDALVGAIAEYLAKQRRLGRVPHWASDPARRLTSPWFTTASPVGRHAGIPNLRQPGRIRVAQHFHRGTAAAARPWPATRQDLGKT